MCSTPQTWGFDRQANFAEREGELIRAAAEAPEAKRRCARARSRALLSRPRHGGRGQGGARRRASPTSATPRTSTALVLRAIANIMLRPRRAGAQGSRQSADRQQQRRAALAGDGLCPAGQVGRGPRRLPQLSGWRWARCRSSCSGWSMRETAARLDRGAATSPAPSTSCTNSRPSACRRELEPTLSVLTGGWWKRSAASRTRCAPIGRRRFRDRRASPRRGGCASCCCGERSATRRARTSSTELETLTTIWRGDETEVEALQLLARHYTRGAALSRRLPRHAHRIAAHPNSELTRKHPGRSGRRPSTACSSPAEATRCRRSRRSACSTTIRELTPIGRRGDEMIRRLADRLVAVDLLDQAAELLQHQVDHRLQGAARAQVATRLADHLPDESQAGPRAGSDPALRARPISRAICASSGCCSRRARSPISAATSWRSRSSPTSRAAKRCGCAPTFCGRRKNGARRPSRSNCCMATAGASSQPLTKAERADILRGAIGLRARRRADRACAFPRQICEQDGGRSRSAGVRGRHRADRRELERIPRRRRHHRQYRHARGVPAPNCASAIPTAASFRTTRRKGRTPCRPAASARHPPFHRRRSEALPVPAPIRAPTGSIRRAAPARR